MESDCVCVCVRTRMQAVLSAIYSDFLILKLIVFDSPIVLPPLYFKAKKQKKNTSITHLPVSKAIFLESSAATITTSSDFLTT